MSYHLGCHPRDTDERRADDPTGRPPAFAGALRKVSDGTRTRDRLDHNTVRSYVGLHLRRATTRGTSDMGLDELWFFVGFRGVQLPPRCHLGAPRSLSRFIGVADGSREEAGAASTRKRYFLYVGF
jgi:hypothetical protein